MGVAGCSSAEDVPEAATGPDAGLSGAAGSKTDGFEDDGCIDVEALSGTFACVPDARAIQDARDNFTNWGNLFDDYDAESKLEALEGARDKGFVVAFEGGRGIATVYTGVQPLRDEDLTSAATPGIVDNGVLEGLLDEAHAILRSEGTELTIFRQTGVYTSGSFCAATVSDRALELYAPEFATDASNRVHPSDFGHFARANASTFGSFEAAPRDGAPAADHAVIDLDESDSHDGTLADVLASVEEIFTCELSLKR